MSVKCTNILPYDNISPHTLYTVVFSHFPCLFYAIYKTLSNGHQVFTILGFHMSLSSSPLSCRAASTDFPDSLSPFVPIIHRFG